MGRSVSTPHNAQVIAYSALEIDREDSEDEEDSQFAFESMVEDLEEYAPTLWPSLRKCDQWLGREDHALLENDLCYIGISEYCGLVAFWIVPKADESVANLCETWISQIESTFQKTWGRLNKLGTFSNGESTFQKKELGPWQTRNLRRTRPRFIARIATP